MRWEDFALICRSSEGKYWGSQHKSYRPRQKYVRVVGETNI